MMWLSHLLVLLLCVCLGFCVFVSGQSGTGWQLYSFCYVQQNTLATSPYLLWSVFAQGTMNVSTASNAGYGGVAGNLVLNITGQRQAYVQGKSIQTNYITGIVPVATYGANDNVVHPSASPYLSMPHSLAFTLDGIAQFAGGPAIFPGKLNGTNMVALAYFYEYNGPGSLVYQGVTETDNPPNDGITNVLTSSFIMATTTSGWSTTYSSCSISVPSSPANSAANVAAFNTKLTWPFCYQFVSGAGQVGQSVYNTTVSGVITTAGYLGSTGSSTTTGYLALGLTGVRTYTVTSPIPGVGSNTTSMPLVAIGAPLSNYMQFLPYRYGSPLATPTYGSGAYYYTNNVLYPIFPNIDMFGISFISSSQIDDEFMATIFPTVPLTSSAFMLYSDGSYLLYDNAFFNEPGYYLYRDPNYADTLVVQSQASYAVALAAAGGTQAGWLTATCGNDYSSAPIKYSFCYYIDNSAIGFGSYTGITSVYGTFTAKTGLTRYGRPAMQLQGMSGIRTLLNTVTGASTTWSLIQLEAPNAFYERYLYQLPGYYVFWLTDNVMFTSYPWFSEAGLGITFADFSNVAYASAYQSVTPYLNLYSTWGTGNGPWGLTEYAVGDLSVYTSATPPYTPFAAGLSLSGFNYTAFVPGQVAQCSALNNKISMEVVTFSFCSYTSSPSGYISQIIATVYAYSTPVYRNGRAGYVVQTLTGLRTYADVNGIMNSDPITGLSGDGIATSFAGFANGSVNAYDNLVYAVAPYVDAEGVLYTVSGPLGDFVTGTGSITGTGLALNSIGRIWYDEGGRVFGGSNPYSYYDQSLYNITRGSIWSYAYLPSPYANVQLIQDNGASAAAGTTLNLYCNQPQTLQFNFCYKLTQTLTSSPFLPWSVYVTGTLTVQTNQSDLWLATGGFGYQVIAATGTRVIQYGGNSYTNNIIGVAPRLAFTWNDNLINVQAPFINSIHVLTFQLDGVARFAGGPIPGLSGANTTYVSLVNFTSTYTTLGAGIAEFDQPINDGKISSVTSQFDLRAWSSSTAYVCPFTPTTINWDSNALALYNTQIQIAMCFYLTAGPGGYGNLAGGYYSSMTSLVLTVTNYGTVSGVPAYQILSATGSRIYTYPNGTTVTNNIYTVGGINAVVHAFPNFFLSSESAMARLASSNVYYPLFPQLDSRGIALFSSVDFVDNQEGDFNSKVDRLLWGGSDWEEWNVDFSTIGHPGIGYEYFNYGGNALFAIYSSLGSSSLSTWSQQCTMNYGTPNQYSFCYYIDNSAATTNANVIYVYGMFTAYGPQNRYNRSALAVIGMNGVRTVRLNNGSSWTQNLINVEYVDQDTYGTGVFVTDNLFFPTSSPPVSVLGISYTLSSAPIGTAGTPWAGTDIIISMASATQFSEIAPSSDVYIAYSAKYVVNTAPYYPGATLASCVNSNISVPAPPTLTTYSFCYAVSGPLNYGFMIAVLGTITVYSTPILLNGRTGYAMANITGTRTYTDGYGNRFVANIAGLSQDWIAAQNGWTFDQLLYPSASPYVDNNGLLYRYAGRINNNNASLFSYDRVVRVFGSSSTPVTEEVFLVNGTSFLAQFASQYAYMQVASAGTITSTSTCTGQIPANGGATAIYTPSSSSSSGSSAGPPAPAGQVGSSSSSNLSGGAIAGVVVGTLVGAFICCVFCFCLGLYGRNNKKEGREGTTTGQSDSQHDPSQLGQSQVEMQQAEHPVDGEATTV